MTQFVLFLWQDKLFKGGVVCTPNASPNPGIWYFAQGAAKPPLPFSDTQGTFEQVAGPALLVKSPNGDLLAVMWTLNWSTAKPGATGAFASAAMTGSWSYEQFDEGRELAPQI